MLGWIFVRGLRKLQSRYWPGLGFQILFRAHVGVGRIHCFAAVGLNDDLLLQDQWDVSPSNSWKGLICSGQAYPE